MRRVALALAWAACAGCPAPQSRVVVEGAGLIDDDDVVSVRVFAVGVDCDDVVFNRGVLAGFAADRVFEGPAASLAGVRVPLQSDALVVAEAAGADGVLVAAGCTRAVFDGTDVVVALEPAVHVTARAVSLWRDGERTIAIDAAGRVLDDAFPVDRGGRVQIDGVVDDVSFADGVAGAQVAGSAGGVQRHRLRGAWQDDDVVVDAVVARATPGPDVVTGRAAALVGDDHGVDAAVVVDEADGDVAVYGLDGDVGVIAAAGDGLVFAGAAGGGYVVARSLDVVGRPTRYELFDRALDRVDVTDVTGLRPPAVGTTGALRRGCAQPGLLIGHDAGRGATASRVTVAGASIDIISADIVSGVAGEVVSAACVASACVDDNAVGVCDLSVGDASVGLFVALESAPTVNLVAQGQVGSDGVLVDGGRVLVPAARADGAVINAFDIVDDRLAFAEVVVALPQAPAVLRQGDGVVVAGAVSNDRGVIYIVDGDVVAPVVVDCVGCAAQVAERVRCSARDATLTREDDCPPLLLVDVSDIDGDGRGEVVVGGFDDDGRRVTIIDLD